MGSQQKQIHINKSLGRLFFLIYLENYASRTSTLQTSKVTLVKCQTIPADSFAFQVSRVLRVPRWIFLVYFYELENHETPKHDVEMMAYHGGLRLPFWHNLLLQRTFFILLFNHEAADTSPDVAEPTFRSKPQ